MLKQLGEEGSIELRCGPNVARLIKKLPHDLRATCQRFLYPLGKSALALKDLSNWLEYELQIQEDGERLDQVEGNGKTDIGQEKGPRGDRKSVKTAMVLHSRSQSAIPSEREEPPATAPASQVRKELKAYCTYCCITRHNLDQGSNFKQLTKDQKITWVKSHNLCWRCGRSHQATQCRLRLTYKTCKGKRVEALHEENTKAAVADPATPWANCGTVSATSDILYMD